MPQDPHVAEVFEGLAGPSLSQRAECTMPPESTGNFEIQHMRRVH